MARVPLRIQRVGLHGLPDDDEIPFLSVGQGGGQQQQRPLPNPSVFPRVPAAHPPPLAALQEPLSREEEDVIPSVSQPARLPKTISDPNFGLFLLGIANSSSSNNDNDDEEDKTRAGGGGTSMNPLSMLHGQDGPIKTIHDFAAKLVPLHELFADQLKGRYHCSSCRVLNPNRAQVCFLCNHDQELPPPRPSRSVSIIPTVMLNNNNGGNA